MENKERNYQGFINQFRKKHVPLQYNQIRLLDELANPEIDHYISISNRTDGKSINYVHALLKIAVEYDLGLFFITRSWSLRPSYQELIDEVLEISDIFEPSDFTFIRAADYLLLRYRNKNIGMISDLGNASDLKLYSNLIKDFPIIIYDEFLALETDYLPDEWVRLKTIYESIDRKESYPLIGKPKIIYLGNAVNFDSPILNGLKIFNILENHPINTAKIYKYDFNVMLEINVNENANEKRNTRAFASADDGMTTAQFETNSHHIATENDRQQVRKNPRFIYVKLAENYLKIWFNRDTLDIILSVESMIQEEYHYNTLLKDNRSNSIYLNERYYDEQHIKKIDRGDYLFDNNYSKVFITSNFHELKYLKINKLIREFLRNDTETLEQQSKEIQLEKNYIEQTKKGLMRKFWG